MSVTIAMFARLTGMPANVASHRESDEMTDA
jgi:hypothetical protein